MIIQRYITSTTFSSQVGLYTLMFEVKDVASFSDVFEPALDKPAQDKPVQSL